MTKAELLAAARGKPLPFEFAGFTCHLLPIAWGELKSLRANHERGNAEKAEAFTYEVIARAVCNETGEILLTAADCEQFPLATLDALFNEIARRSGVSKAAEPGKAESPATPS
jgi:hypothetical protein